MGPTRAKVHRGPSCAPKAPSGLSPDCLARSPMSALVGASLMPLLMRSNTLPAACSDQCRSTSSGGSTTFSMPAVIQYSVAVVP